MFNNALNNTEIEILNIISLRNLHVEKPEIQRIIDTQKVDDIVDYQLRFYKEKKFFNFSASNLINIHIWNDKHLLVDGQHRLQAIERLYDKYSHVIEFYVLFVKVNSKEELEENYNMINKNTPLPDFSNFQSINKSIPENVSIEFQLKYPTIWSKTSRARRPHLYFNFFQESLAFICNELNVVDTKYLLKIITQYNDKLKGWHQSSFSKINESMYRKANETGMYLGLFQHYHAESYGYVWARKIVEEQSGKIIKNKKKISKKSIPKKIKADTWDKYIGPEKGEAPCLCCRSTIINSKNFEAGHIISEKQGGVIKVENIVPICSACNKSMGIRNMGEFIKEHYPDNYEKFSRKDYKDNKHSWSIKKLVNF